MTLTYGTLFSGIGGFDAAFDRADLSCQWQVEIDDDARSVLERHWPHVEKQRDVTACGGHNLRTVDLVAGGFPCQDLSVAGRRAGLAGERSGLWFEFHRILRELTPRWVVIENVPGLLSSNDGQDFAILLGGLTGVIPRVPDGGWQSAGIARGWWYGVAWRVLDAQHFSLAQRRRRVFIVGHLGSGRAAQVLFERDGGYGDTAPRRQTGQRVAAPLTHGSGITGNAPGRRREDDVNIVPEVSDSLRAQAQLAHREDVDTLVPVAGSLTSRYGKGADSTVSDPLVYACRSVAAALTSNYGKQPDNSDTNLGPNLIALTNRGYDTGDVGETLHAASHGALPMVAQSLLENQRGEMYLSDVDTSLSAGGGKPGQGYAAIAIGIDGSDVGFARSANPSHSGDKGDGGVNCSMVVEKTVMGVRRLTPIECERLQGFDDNWTDGQSDSARYRQLGNAVAVPVAEWIARRIVAVERGDV